MNNKLLLFFCAVSFTTLAQQTESTSIGRTSVYPIEEMRLKLSEDGSRYLKWTFLNQVWLRHTDTNPGTQVMGKPANQIFDIGLRRTRIQFYGQLTDHVLFYTQFGQNNFNYLAGQNAANAGNRKFQVFFHDALIEYKIWKSNDRLKLGGGLTIANGLSRFSQPSIGSIMSMDVPVFAQATVDQTDEFARKLSLYARGQLGKFDYRVVLSDPFPVTSSGTPAAIGEDANFSFVGHHKQYQGFFIYNFFDKEPHTTPYMTGTYLGKKKVFNIEAGFITQKNAMWSRETVLSDTVYHNMNLWSAALYYDAPINSEKGTALSAYVGFYALDYGKNYLRYNGIMNPAFPGGKNGNAFPMFGTGNVVYAQIGYLFKHNLLGEHGTLMPYATLQSGDYDAIMDRMTVYNIGVNWLIKGHTSKISLDYQNRPVYNSSDEVSARKRQIVLQYQISF